MRYFFAIVLPPVAMILCGKPFQAVLNFLLMLTGVGWILASLWALFVVNSKIADERQEKLIAAIEAQAGRPKKKGFRWI